MTLGNLANPAVVSVADTEQFQRLTLSVLGLLRGSHERRRAAKAGSAPPRVAGNADAAAPRHTVGLTDQMPYQAFCDAFTM
jgi:hypothetical protein